MKILIVVMFALLFVAPTMADTWYNVSYLNRVYINITSYRHLDMIEVNLTSLGITCSNKNCTDVVVTNNTHNELVYPDGSKAWQIPQDNITSRNKPRNDFVVFVPQNNALTYYIYYNNTGVNNTGGSILLWEDNFYRYNNGDKPLKYSGGTGSVCTTYSGKKGAGCITGGAYIAWNVTQFTNISFIFELNETDPNTNSLRFDIGSNGTAPQYRIPQVSGINTYGLNYNGGADLASITSNVDNIALNFSGGINGTLRYIALNHTDWAQASDTQLTTHSTLTFSPGIVNRALLSLRVWNRTMNTYNTSMTFNVLFDGVPRVTINSPLNITLLNSNVTLNFTVVDDVSSSLKCWRTVDSVETLITPNITNSTTYQTPLANLSDGSHTVSVSCQNGNAINGTTTVQFTTIKPTLVYCGPVSSTVAFNMTIYEEDTPTQKLRADADATFTIYSLGTAYNTSFSFVNNNSYTICINPANTSFIVNATIQYWNTSTHPLRDYFLVNAPISNETSYVNLYLLPSGSNNIVSKLTVKDQNLQVKPGVIIKAQRYYAGTNTYITVAMAKTDTSGIGVTRLKFLDPFYKFVVEENGVVLRNFEPTKVTVDPSTNEFAYELDLSASGLGEYFSTFQGISHSCTFNNATFILRCTVSDGSNLITTATLYAEKENRLSWDTVCSASASGPASTLLCPLGATPNGTYQYTLTVQLEETSYILESGPIPGIAPSPPIYGSVGLFVALLLYLALSFAGIYNPHVSIVFGIFALAITALMEFWVISLASFGALVTAIGIVLYRSGNRG